MKADERIKVIWSKLPKPIDVIGPNGEIVTLKVMPTKDHVGAFINK